MTSNDKKENHITIDEIRGKLRNFAEERDWNQFHTPRNLLLALVGEVGELSEIFQWKGEVKEGVPEFTTKEKEHLSEELADVMCYLVRLSDKCGIDLGEACISKIAKNGEKYPVEKSKSSSKKYNDL
jgi:dCTP diphosphatase